MTGLKKHFCLTLYHRLFPLVLLFAPFAVHAGMVITGTAGMNSGDHFRGIHFGYGGALYGKVDDQTLIGVQAGQGTVRSESSIPITASGIFRLPLGRIVLPVLTGDAGYAIDGSHSGFIWRGGGGFDIRNGRHSSIIALGGYEGFAGQLGWMGRMGLLLEF